MINYQILTGFANQLNQSSDCYDVIVAIAAQPKYASALCSDAFNQARYPLCSFSSDLKLLTIAELTV